MVILDKEYNPVSPREVRALVKDYVKAAYIPEIWDCDDIARDIVNYVKTQAKEVLGKNVAFGMLILKDHAQEIFVDKLPKLSKRNRSIVLYLNHTDWRIYAPNKRPKWILI